MGFVVQCLNCKTTHLPSLGFPWDAKTQHPCKQTSLVAILESRLSLCSAEGSPQPGGSGYPRPSGIYLSMTGAALVKWEHSHGDFTHTRVTTPLGCFHFQAMSDFTHTGHSWFKELCFQEDSSASGWSTSAPCPIPHWNGLFQTETTKCSEISDPTGV